MVGSSSEEEAGVGPSPPAWEVGTVLPVPPDGSLYPSQDSEASPLAWLPPLGS